MRDQLKTKLEFLPNELATIVVDYACVHVREVKGQSAGDMIRERFSIDAQTLDRNAEALEDKDFTPYEQHFSLRMGEEEIPLFDAGFEHPGESCTIDVFFVPLQRADIMLGEKKLIWIYVCKVKCHEERGGWDSMSSPWGDVYIFGFDDDTSEVIEYEGAVDMEQEVRSRLVTWEEFVASPGFVLGFCSSSIITTRRDFTIHQDPLELEIDACLHRDLFDMDQDEISLLHL